MSATGEKDSPLPGSNAVERLRRSISAAWAAEAVKAEPEDSFASLQNDDDDSSMVLYRDPSRVSMQRSKASVVSGAHEQGDTFFTALKKQPSWQSDADSDLSSPTTLKEAYGLLSCADSQSNPVQSLSHSAYFSAAGDDSATGSLNQYEEGSQQSGLGASLEPSYATSLPDDGMGGGRAGCGPFNAACSQQQQQLTSSVLDIINSLYGGQAASNTGQPWHQLSKQDQPLMALAAAADAVKAAAGEADEADAEPTPRSSSPGMQQDVENSAGAVLSSTLSAEAASSSLSDASGSQQPPTLLLQQLQQEEEVQPGRQDHGELQGSDDSTTDSQARLAAMDGMHYDSSGLQQELSCYLQELNSKADEDGSPLVQLTGDYAVLVERLLREGRTQHYRALQGWEGPHRFEDLPVAQLQTSHSDPQVAAGLLAVAKLDEELREASLKALVSARALNPEQWADAEKCRLERRAAELDAALAKERKQRAHAAQLRNVLVKLDEQCSEASLQSPWRGGASFSYYRLKPQEEDLLAAVLTRDEQTMELDNPFDPHQTCLDELPDGAATPGADQSSLQQSSDVRDTAAAATASHPQDDTVAASSEQSAAGSETDVAAPTGQVQAGAEGAAAAAGVQPGPISRASSCLSSSVFSMMMRPSSSGLKGRRCSLADIDARLQAIKAEKEGARQLPTTAAGTSRASSAKASQSSSRTLSSQRSTSRPASSSLSPSAAAGPPPSGSTRPSRAASCQSTPATAAWHSTTSNSRRASAASSNSLGRSSSTVHTIDYIREQREVKELLKREHELDTQLRALQTSELPTTLTAQQLQTLLQCAY